LKTKRETTAVGEEENSKVTEKEPQTDIEKK
jgi:hypothetical protein